MTARWHLGPVTGLHFWAVLVTSPEVLVFLFFMITDPKTAPTGARPRLVYAVSLGLLATLMIAPTTTEFAAKVALLGSLAIVCVAMPVVRLLPPATARDRSPGRACRVCGPARRRDDDDVVLGCTRCRARPAADRPPRLARSAVAARHRDRARDRNGARSRRTRVRAAQDVARARHRPGPAACGGAGSREEVPSFIRRPAASWALGSDTGPATAEVAPPPTVRGFRMRDVAASSGIDFHQGSFRFGMSNDTKAMMGGGVCWIDYNGDGWLDLFAVNSYASADTARWEAHGGLPRTALYENVRRSFPRTSAAQRTPISQCRATAASRPTSTATAAPISS